MEERREIIGETISEVKRNVISKINLLYFKMIRVKILKLIS